MNVLINKLKGLLEITDDSEDMLLDVILEQATSVVLQRLFPYDDSKTDIPTRYQYKVLEIAVYLYNKRGAEGQLAHKETDISRTYEAGSIPPSMVEDITPYVGVM